MKHVRRWLLAAVSALMLALPLLPVPEFWITQLNLIGLYAIVALGGFGSLLGTLFAALLVGVIQSVTVVYLPPAFKDAFVFASYLLIGLFRPQGLFGRF